VRGVKVVGKNRPRANSKEDIKNLALLNDLKQQASVVVCDSCQRGL